MTQSGHEPLQGSIEGSEANETFCKRLVHALQDQFKLVPLSSYGKPFTPPAGTVDPSIDMKTAVREQVNRMDAVSYFTLLAQLMKANPPAAADAPELAKFAKIGLIAGKNFDASKLDADLSNAFRKLPLTASCFSSRFRKIYQEYQRLDVRFRSRRRLWNGLP